MATARSLPGGNADPWVTVLMTTTSVNPSSSKPIPSSTGNTFNTVIATVIPLVIVCTATIMIGIGYCICNWRKGRRGYNMEGIHTYKSHNTCDDSRCSVGIQTSRKMSTPKDFVPILDRISESPEDRLRKEMPLGLHSEESILSVLSRLHFDVAEAAHYLANDPGNTSHSYPSLAVHPQPPFSPYHLTWVTPSGNRHVISEPNIRSVTRLQRHSDSGSIPSNTSWRSPYHHNYNTPTVTRSTGIPANVVIHNKPKTEVPHSNTPTCNMAARVDYNKRRSEPIVGTGKRVKNKHPDELILSASNLMRMRDRGSETGSVATSSVCAVCSNTYNQGARPTCECCSTCVCQPQPNIPSTESLTGNVGSTDTSIQRRSNELSFQHLTADQVCHGSCDTTSSGEHSSSQSNSTIYYPGPSHSTSIGPSTNTSQNLGRNGFIASLPASGLATRNASPNLTPNDTICSAPARVSFSKGNHDKMVESGTQTCYDISCVAYGPPPPPYRPRFQVERVTPQAVFATSHEQPSQDSMANLSTDVHQSTTHVPGREASYEWDAYPFYPHLSQNSVTYPHQSQSSAINSSQSSSGIVPVCPILSEVQHWV